MALSSDQVLPVTKEAVDELRHILLDVTEEMGSFGDSEGLVRAEFLLTQCATLGEALDASDDDGYFRDPRVPALIRASSTPLLAHMVQTIAELKVEDVQETRSLDDRGESGPERQTSIEATVARERAIVSILKKDGEPRRPDKRSVTWNESEDVVDDWQINTLAREKLERGEQLQKSPANRLDGSLADTADEYYSTGGTSLRLPPSDDEVEEHYVSRIGTASHAFADMLHPIATPARQAALVEIADEMGWRTSGKMHLGMLSNPPPNYEVEEGDLQNRHWLRFDNWANTLAGEDRWPLSGIPDELAVAARDLTVLCALVTRGGDLDRSVPVGSPPWNYLYTMVADMADNMPGVERAEWAKKRLESILWMYCVVTNTHEVAREVASGRSLRDACAASSADHPNSLRLGTVRLLDIGDGYGHEVENRAWSMESKANAEKSNLSADELCALEYDVTFPHPSRPELQTLVFSVERRLDTIASPVLSFDRDGVWRKLMSTRIGGVQRALDEHPHTLDYPTEVHKMRLRKVKLEMLESMAELASKVTVDYPGRKKFDAAWRGFEATEDAERRKFETIQEPYLRALQRTRASRPGASPTGPGAPRGKMPDRRYKSPYLGGAPKRSHQPDLVLIGAVGLAGALSVALAALQP